MLPLTKEQEAALGLELAAKRQEHADLDAAIHTLSSSGYSDQMLIQRIRGVDGTARRCELPSELIVRRSSGPAPS